VQCAASYGYHQSLEILLKSNAFVDAISRSGKTALLRVVDEETDKPEKYFLSAEALIKYDANINFQDEYGNSILQNTKKILFLIVY